ncbi:unnamed protein product [Lymnaea stagnalis]|uniref:Transmembrane protein n=1 Tax=Lymnaea stagnalis TaxID=6523 RepID=A0AAV2HHY7_LYMST
MGKIHNFSLLLLVIGALVGTSMTFSECDPHERCNSPDTETRTSYCRTSQLYIECLYKEAMYNDMCTDSTKTRYQAIISSAEDERSRRHCSGGVGLSSSLVLCVAGFVYAISNK